MIRPLRSNVLLRASEAPQTSSYGIIITNVGKDEAEVVAIGSEVKEIKIGDVVRYDVASSRKVEQYIMCREADVLCVIE